MSSDSGYNSDDPASDPKQAKATAGPPQKKKRLVINKPDWRIRGRRGALGAFAELPICKNVDHATLYSLSLTAKPFRAVLASKAASAVWDRAREEAGLPQLAANELSPIQYAHLVHGKWCQACDAAGRRTKGHPIHQVRVRLCKVCEKELVVREREWDSYGASRALQLSQHRFPKLWHYKPFLKQMETLLMRDHPDPTAPATKTYTDLRQITLDRRAMDGLALLEWEKMRKEAQKADRQGVRDARKTELERRLLLEGWDESDFDADWAQHKLVRETTRSNAQRIVTDRTWNNLKPELEAYLAARRAEREADALLDRQWIRRQNLIPLYNSFKASLPTKEADILPRLFDILNLDAIRQLWAPDPEDDVEVDQAMWDDAMRESNLAECQRELKADFYRLAVKAHRKSTVPMSVPANADAPTDAEIDRALSRSTAVFSCQHHVQDEEGERVCSFAAPYPLIVKHIALKHGRSINAEWHSASSRRRIDGSVVKSNSGEWMQVGEDVSLSKWVVTLGQGVFAEVSPRDRKRCRFSCRLCPHDRESRRTFAQSITHLRAGHLDDSCTTLPLKCLRLHRADT
ncbi:hypothetical protein RQP46_002841 [Phenoliferia psychrophenolica]